ncbi:MAG: Hsp70 family protein [Tepidisphaerales bacterium]
MNPQFAIGIDLGTTNSVLAYTPLGLDKPDVKVLPIPQLVAPGAVEPRNMLPSFLYLASDAERDALQLPWSAPIANRKSKIQNLPSAVGAFAQKQSADVPTRSVAAAKSWLCHSKVDRRQPILPWGAPAEVHKVSPVEASRQYLAHLVAAWTAAFPQAPFAEQKVVLTVPASFDPAARELTREAALAAGFPENFVLLEEPQAALYSWLNDAGDRWRKQLKVGDTLLVCDVGGGTTDLTLIAVAEENGELVLRRLAVGNHTLVGGDNMDLALAFASKEAFAKKGQELNPWQSVALWHSCRSAKEALLGEKPPAKHPVTILGRGSKLIGGTISVDLTRDDVQTLLLDGFFPACELSARPEKRRVSGFREIGLPYEMDTAITRHLAAFLSANLPERSLAVPPTPSSAESGRPGTVPEPPVRAEAALSSANLPTQDAQSTGNSARNADPTKSVRNADPTHSLTHILFNGGVFKAGKFRERLMQVIEGWFPRKRPLALEGHHDLDFAVAKGAAYYAATKEAKGVRIRGGAARSYYIGIETAGLAIPGAPRPMKALCVVPWGMEEGAETEIPAEEIGLVVGEASNFAFLASSSRKNDRPGQVLEAWKEGELAETDPMVATLPAAEQNEDGYVPVKFKARITELGVFELWCVSGISKHQWKLEFSVREPA